MKNGGGHFAPELGGHFELESGGHFKLELGGQYHWNLQNVLIAWKLTAHGLCLKTGIIKNVIAIKQVENQMEERQWQNRFYISNKNVV